MKQTLCALAIAFALIFTGCALLPSNGGEGASTPSATDPLTEPQTETTPLPETEPETEAETIPPETNEFGFAPETDRTPIY